MTQLNIKVRLFQKTIHIYISNEYHSFPYNDLSIDTTAQNDK